MSPHKRSDRARDLARTTQTLSLDGYPSGKDTFKILIKILYSLIRARDCMFHILLVDDDEDLCFTFSHFLQIEGYTVTTVSNGNEVIEKFLECAPDLIILDLIMPKIDGFEVCARIRSLSDVPIVLFSGIDRDIDKIRGFQAGANDYLIKSFDLSGMLARIEAVLGVKPIRAVESTTC